MHAKLGVLASPAGKGLVQRLGLTDICLFTEARYTRHPSQADIFSPAQDGPQAWEHFPSGSMVDPARGKAPIFCGNGACPIVSQ